MGAAEEIGEKNILYLQMQCLKDEWELEYLHVVIFIHMIWNVTVFEGMTGELEKYFT